MLILKTLFIVYLKFKFNCLLYFHLLNLAKYTAKDQSTKGGPYTICLKTKLYTQLANCSIKYVLFSCLDKNTLTMTKLINIYVKLWYFLYEWKSIKYKKLLKLVMFMYVCVFSEFQFSSVQSLSHVQLFATPWTAALQASLSITNSQSLLKLMSIELVMPSNHLILCRPFLPPSIFPSIRVFSNESVLYIRWPKY